MSLDREIYLTSLSKAMLNSRQSARYFRLIHGTTSSEVVLMVLLMDRYPNIKTVRQLYNYFDDIDESDFKSYVADALHYDLIEIDL